MKFQKGQVANPKGRPKGTFQRHVQLAKLVRDNGEEIIQRCVELALAGDSTCMKICMDRVVPLKTSKEFEMPDIKDKTPEQLTSIMFEAMSGQVMSLDEINCILNMIKTFRSNDDSEAIKELIASSNEMLEELRIKNERDY